MNNVTQPYELTFILDEKFNAEDAQVKTDAIKKTITKLGGNVTKEEMWGRRELAYEIKRNRTGFYVTLWIDLPTESIKPIEQELRFDERVIRFLTTKAYTSAQPGTLYPVSEQEKTNGTKEKEENTSGEEMLRRTSAAPAKPEAKAEKVENMEDELPEDQRLEKLDEALEELLKDQE